MGKPHKRSIWRRIRHGMVYWGARSAYGFLRALPLSASIRFARALGGMAYSIALAERRRALEQLERALGEAYNLSQRRAIVRGMFANMGQIAAEMAYIPRLNREFLSQYVRLEGEEHFREAMARAPKCGMIAITAHLGAWEWIQHWGAIMEGVNIAVVARELSNPLIQDWTERLRQAHGAKVIYRKQAGLPAVRLLRKGGGIGILADQCTKGEGVFTPFFGRPAHTLTGPARLAIATRAAVLPMFMIREPGEGLSWTLHCFPILEIPQDDDPRRQVFRLTAQIASVIEEAVRRWPDQWMWVHRRWKRTPETDPDPVFDPHSPPAGSQTAH